MQAVLNPCSSHPPFATADVQRIAALACDADSAPKDWVAAVGAIPELSSRMLQVLNASYGGLPGRIASIPHAIAVLGFYTVKTLASRLALATPKAR